MPTLESLAKRIESASDLATIVRTMKSLAFVTIRQYERAAEAIAQYSRTIDLGLSAVLDDARGLDRLPPESRGSQRGVIVFGSDHGLCGRFNDDIADFADGHLQERGQDGSWRILTAGVRPSLGLAALGHPIEDQLSLPGSARGLSGLVQSILLRIDSWQSDGVGEVVLIHSRRRGESPAEPQAASLLPVDWAELARLARAPWPSRGLPFTRMERRDLLAHLLRQRFFVRIFRAATESAAAEHASRLASMQAAERNIRDRLEEMEATYRHLRQEAITAELLDVVSGYEAIVAPRP